METMLSGIEIVTPAGACFLHERHLARLPGTDPAIASRLRLRLGAPLPEDLERDPAVRLWREQGVESAAFLDLETTGFGTGPIILAGVLAFYEGEYRFRIYLARNYAEEGPMIEALAADLRRRPVLITYNGKSYDLPFLRERRGRLRLGSEPPRAVFDVLHAARRRWKGRFSDLRLSTLEHHLFRRPRILDIPGRDIPAVYHRFVRSGNAAALVPILQHNLVDLYSLCEVTERVLATHPQART